MTLAANLTTVSPQISTLQSFWFNFSNQTLAVTEMVVINLRIDNVVAPALTLVKGIHYTDVSDSSVSGHPLAI